MSCPVTIPLDDIVEAIVDTYGSTLTDFVKNELDLSKYVLTQDGVAKGLTLKDGVILDDAVKSSLVNTLSSEILRDIQSTISQQSNQPSQPTQPTQSTVSALTGALSIDDAAKSSLCDALSACISAKVQEELGCDRDNHVISYAIDKVNDKLTITMAFGEQFSVSRAELVSWLDIQPTIISGGDGGTVVVEQKPCLRENVTVTEDYTLTQDNFDNHAIIRADGTGRLQTITIPKPSDDFIKHSIIVRRVNDTCEVNVVGGEGVQLLPAGTDGTTLYRRSGNSVEYVYIGNGIFDAYGELPS